MLPPRLCTTTVTSGYGARNSVRHSVTITEDRLACMSSVPLRRRALSVSPETLGEAVPGSGAVGVKEHRAVTVRRFQQRPHRFGVIAGQQIIARYLRADHARQPERPLELGGGGR